MTDGQDMIATTHLFLPEDVSSVDRPPDTPSPALGPSLGGRGGAGGFLSLYRIDHQVSINRTPHTENTK